MSVDELDGRSARRDRNRDAVLDAVLSLFREDNVSPRPEEVAERSGVSLRSVYRYYSDPAELLRAAMARHLERVAPMAAVPDLGEGTLAQRIERLVDARLAFHQTVGATARAARVAGVHNPVIRRQYERTRRLLRSQVEQQLAPELAKLRGPTRDAVLNAADALLQLDGLDQLRIHRRLSQPKAAAQLRIALTRLLG